MRPNPGRAARTDRHARDPGRGPGPAARVRGDPGSRWRRDCFRKGRTTVSHRKEATMFMPVLLTLAFVGFLFWIGTHKQA